MDATIQIERALQAAVAIAEAASGPPRLAAAIRHAVFPGGARVRPRVCLAVAAACGGRAPAAAVAAAAAIELLHCASLVHDDLPCFDDAATRRGLPSVHKAFGERLAVLAGDALIVLAFDTLVRGCRETPQRLAALVGIVARAVGAPHGIVAGQAWECETRVVLRDYQQAKTGALFVAAAMAGAESVGADAENWRRFGERLGEAYQVADDIRDVVADCAQLGKPVGRDAALGRPSVAAELGLDGAIAYFATQVEATLRAIPPCRGADALRRLVAQEAARLLPADLLRLAA